MPNMNDLLNQMEYAGQDLAPQTNRDDIDLGRLLAILATIGAARPTAGLVPGSRPGAIEAMADQEAFNADVREGSEDRDFSDSGLLERFLAMSPKYQRRRIMSTLDVPPENDYLGLLDSPAGEQVLAALARARSRRGPGSFGGYPSR